MTNSMKAVLAIFLALPLSACVGGPIFQDRTAARVGAMVAMGERIADDTTQVKKASVCPPGQVSVGEQYNRQQQSTMQWTENYGNQWGGGWGSQPQVYNPLPAGNTANPTLNIYAGVQAQRSVTCVKPQPQR